MSETETTRSSRLGRIRPVVACATGAAHSLRALAVGGVLAAAVACNPCFGVGSCDGQPHLTIAGTLVEQTSGRAVAGVRVDVIRTGGPELSSDSVSTTTAADGHWQIAVDARSTGDAIVDVNVNAPGIGAYRARDLHFSITGRRGEGHVLPTWVVNPYFAYAAELHYRTTQDSRIGGADVEFHRTSGIDYYIAAVDQVFVGRTDDAGRIALFDATTHAISLGEVVGDLVVHLPPPLSPDTIHGLHLSATQLLHTPTQIIVLEAGP